MKDNNDNKDIYQKIKEREEKEEVHLKKVHFKKQKKDVIVKLNIVYI